MKLPGVGDCVGRLAGCAILDLSYTFEDEQHLNAHNGFSLMYFVDRTWKRTQSIEKGEYETLSSLKQSISQPRTPSAGYSERYQFISQEH